MAGALAAAGMLPLEAAEAPASGSISRTAELIHFEPEFKASLARVCAALLLLS
jgi:hypothetical protein